MDQNQTYMRIGEFAEFFEVSQKALRIYEKKGILRPAYIDCETGYRYYTADQVKQLNAVMELKAIGFSLSDIKKIIEVGTDSAILIQMLKKRYTAWQEEKLLAENKMEAIAAIVERVENRKDEKRMEDMTEEERAWLLAKMVCVEDVKTQHIISEAIWL